MAGLRVGVIGDPVAHSLSPVFQQAALDALGIEAHYERWHTPADELSGRIASLRGGDALGANVTVPHKERTRELVDTVSPLAAAVGAVNTIVPRDDELHGDNTDVYGFQKSLVDARPAVRRDAVLVLGAGGAARAVLMALGELEVARIGVANRSIERAERVVDELIPGGAATMPLNQLSIVAAIRDYSVIVNATSIGWNSDEAVLSDAVMDEIGPGPLVVDLTYRSTALLRSAERRGLPTLDGLPMLVHQGARSFELWTGKPAPTEVMMRAAEAARSAG